jgi:hypothetical protein
MENKKKPSTVTLFYSHDYDFKPGVGVLLRDEMLNWPIFEFNGQTQLNEVRTKTHRDAFSSLLKIEPFDSVVSIKVDEKNKRLIRAYKTRGQIFLNGESVLNFSYHSKDCNKRFVSLEEWPEIEINHQTASVESGKDWSRVYKTLSEWGVDQWIEFFFKRIKDKAEALNKKAQAKRSDAQSLEGRAEKILEAFS